MNLQLKIAFEGNLATFSDNVQKAMAGAARDAVEEYGTKAKLRLRDEVRRGGLGDRVANSVQLKVYPASASNRTLAPASYVYTKAPKIIDAFSNDTTIVPVNGATYLAIPTGNVPMKGKHRATPVDVENMFNQDLIFIHAKSSRDEYVAYVDVLKSKNGRGFRARSKGRMAQGRQSQLVPMFIMVRQVHLSQRINWAGVVADLNAQWPDYFAQKINAALDAA